MGGCASLGTWLQLQGLRGVDRGSSTCGTSSFTTDAAETKDMQVHVHIYMIAYDHTHAHTHFNKSLIVKVVMGSCSLESVLSMLA